MGLRTGGSHKEDERYRHRVHAEHVKKRIIPDEAEEPQPIDFSWFYFVGRNKLGLTYKEVGRMTYTLFSKLYQHYKDDFDIEMRLRASGTTYEQLEEQAVKEEEWF